MDVLEQIVAGLELRTSLYFRAAFSSPFGVSVPEDRRRIRLHVAGPGRSWIGLPSGESAFYETGDLILVPHGSAHVLASGPAQAAIPLDEVLATNPPAEGLLRYGSGGETAELVCGHFEFDETIVHPLFELLPPLIHLKANARSNFAWMPPLLEAAEHEAGMEAPANLAVARRLSEILFIQVLRVVSASSETVFDFLGLVDDPQLARALESIHANPGGDWSLESLAAAAGASRSAFADRFRKRIGVTPMRYLTDWRMRKARELLSDRTLSVSEVGRRVGYASEAAFNRVFREVVGEPPGRHRRALPQRVA